MIPILKHSSWLLENIFGKMISIYSLVFCIVSSRFVQGFIKQNKGKNGTFMRRAGIIRCIDARKPFCI